MVKNIALLGLVAVLASPAAAAPKYHHHRKHGDSLWNSYSYDSNNDNGGWSWSWSYGDGQDGQDGQNGANGANGQNGANGANGLNADDYHDVESSVAPTPAATSNAPPQSQQPSVAPSPAAPAASPEPSGEEDECDGADEPAGQEESDNTDECDGGAAESSAPAQSAPVQSTPAAQPTTQIQSTAAAAESTSQAAPQTSKAVGIAQSQGGPPTTQLLADPAANFTSTDSVRIADNPTAADIDGSSAASKQMLDTHNAVRAQFGAKPVTWNATLAQWATDEIGTCNWAHVPAPDNYSLNNLYKIWMSSSGGSYVADEGVADWANEFHKYDFANPGDQPPNPVLHFTEMVWKNVTSIGCGWRLDCQSPASFYLSCRYAPPGNMYGQYAEMVGAFGSQVGS